ncbi:cupredoxin domain-containing protein [Pseudobacillus badius]|uniref:cupredoxin domain-containing protein n=1 Tax=Bacillus badius TaxID=1455 RepID=UPI003D34E327
MSSSLIIMLVCSIFLISMVIIVPLKKNDKVSQMAGMMAAMSVGMTLGLLAGTILGVIFKGDLFLSTVIGMIIGATVGSIAGVPFNSYALVDGGLSGVMGGMMGAMLGEMIAPGQSESMIKIMFTLFVCSQLTIFYILNIDNGKEAKGRYLRFYKNPMFMAIGVLSFFYVFNQLPPIFNFNDPLTKQESKNSPLHHAGSQEIIISATDYSYGPSSLIVNSQQEVTLKLVNEGKVEHDLEIVGLTAEIMKNNEMHEHQNKQNSTVHLHAKAGEEAQLTFKPLETGQFSFYCTVPGHKEAGMIGTFDIS